MNITGFFSTNSTDLSFWSLGTLEESIFIFNFLVSPATNVYIIWQIVTGGGIALEFFDLNLSVCEICYGINALLILLSGDFPRLVMATTFFIGLGITGRPVFQSLMCVERFLAVVHPMTFLKFKPLRYRIFCCSVAWTFILASCLFCMFTLGIFVVEFVCFFSLQFLIFFSIQLFCLLLVLRALRQSGPGERKEEDLRKRRAFHIILITSLTMIVMFAPFIMTGFLTLVEQQNLTFLWSISLSCFILTGFVQPVLFLRRAGKLPFSCICCTD